MLPISIIKTND